MTWLKRIGQVFGVAFAIGLLMGLGGALATGAAGLVMGGLVLVASRGKADGGAKQAMWVSATVAVAFVLLMLIGQSTPPVQP